MKMNYAVAAVDSNQKLLHLVYYEEPVTESALFDLYDEMFTDEELGLAGRRDYQLVPLTLDQSRALLDSMNIPVELNEGDGNGD